MILAAAVLSFGIVGTQLPTSEEAAEGDVSNIRNIFFQTTPNLYFVSFESLAPQSLLDKYLGVEDTGFHRLFDAHFRLFRNFFANAATTFNSLNSLLALDMDVYSSIKRELKDRGDNTNPFLFSGHNPSPLLGILHENGYTTTSMYPSDYLGKVKGKYIDNYLTFERENLCGLLDSGSRRQIAFWGYCQFSMSGEGSAVGRRKAQTSIVDLITKINTNEGPQFVMAHITSPAHTRKIFRYSNVVQLQKFRDYYIEETKIAARYLKIIVDHLEENDPNAILLVYGDHGPLLSRGLEFEGNREFVFQDHYGILGGVYPPDVCANELDKASAKGYMTTLDAVHALLRCLSGGESAFVEPREYKFPKYGPIPRGANLDYKEFLYE